MKNDTAPRQRHLDSRRTRQRDVILETMRQSVGFVSAQEVFSRLRESNTPVGLTTVYRHLQILNEDGVLDSIRSSSGEMLYRLCSSKEHHHHIICSSCGHIDEVEAPEVEKWVQQASASRGFTQVSHLLEMYGLCDGCSTDET